MKCFKNYPIIWMCMLLIAMSLGGFNTVQAQENDSLNTILLWPGGAPGAKGNTPADKPSIALFKAPASKANGTAVLICPGGGYAMEAINKEGYKVAHWLNGLGVTAFVLKYRHGPRYQYPAPFQDAVRAMHIIRSRAADWSIDTSRVGIMGFSAGGHLASTVGTHWKHPQHMSMDPLKNLSSRPDFMILAYPVITMKDSFTHEGSKHMLLGKNPKPSLVALLSNEDQVSRETPPTFLVQGTNDHTVPVENSIAFYQALHAHHVPVEMHLFENGPHGFGLGQHDPALSQWPGLCATWLRRHHLITTGSNE